MLFRVSGLASVFSSVFLQFQTVTTCAQSSRRVLKETKRQRQLILLFCLLISGFCLSSVDKLIWNTAPDWTQRYITLKSHFVIVRHSEGIPCRARVAVDSKDGLGRKRPLKPFPRPPF